MKIKGTLQKIIFESTNETKLLLTNVRIENLTIKINFSDEDNNKGDENENGNESIELNLNNTYVEDITIKGKMSERILEILEKANLGNKICLNLQETGTSVINAKLNSIEIESEE